ncbi:PQQ-binding-like beta-propeller repeat protein [Streptomyces sp. NPDC048623]|uniref:outer membrane protein assembly factor BamB family protein n=1 Tax=Streptomyces sp. NPDC048623 TaxID=3155761 RepID=UPI00343C09A1
MTQPPPPPNQPPGPPPGGFGAPQDPQSGGFGVPTPPPPAQPPAQPPYGYPQPGQPVQQPVQPPYGYPQEQPQGQPQQPYGYPTQPMYQQTPPPPVPGSGGRKKLSAQAQIIIAAVVAIVLIVGAGLWYANSGSDDPDTPAKGGSGGASAGQNGGQDGGAGGLGGGGKEKVPADPKSVASFQLPVPKVPDVTNIAGSWLTDKAFVKTGVDSITGYDLDKGTVVWTLPLTGQVCGASRHITADYKLPILFEAAKRTAPKYYQPCTEVGLVDLTTGKIVWTKSLTGGTAGDKKVTFAEITLHGQTVAAGGLDGGAAFDLANGNPRWKPQAAADNCRDLGYGGGEGLVAVRKCGSSDDPTVTIQNLDPMSGQPLSQFKMPTGVEWASIVSTKPLVVAAEVGDVDGDGSGISDFFSIDEKTGKLKAKITADPDRYAARCRSSEVESCTQAVVGNGRLYVPTEEHEGSTGEYGDETNEIVAFDLNTGQLTPNKADAGDRYTLLPLRMDGGNVIAYKLPPYDKGGQIVSIDGGTMKSTLLMENPSEKTVRDAETSYSSLSAEWLYANGRFFVSGRMVSENSSSSVSKQYLAVGFRIGG